MLFERRHGFVENFVADNSHANGPQLLEVVRSRSDQSRITLALADAFHCRPEHPIRRTSWCFGEAWLCLLGRGGGPSCDRLLPCHAMRPGVSGYVLRWGTGLIKPRDFYSG